MVNEKILLVIDKLIGSIAFVIFVVGVFLIIIGNTIVVDGNLTESFIFPIFGVSLFFFQFIVFTFLIPFLKNFHEGQVIKKGLILTSLLLVIGVIFIIFSLPIFHPIYTSQVWLVLIYGLVLVFISCLHFYYFFQGKNV